MRHERSKPGGPWPAVVGLGIIAGVTALVWWKSLDFLDPGGEIDAPLAGSSRAPSPPAAAAPPLPAVVEAVSAVAAFANNEIPPRSPDARESTAEGLRLIAHAMATRGDSVLWRDRALRMRESAQAVEHAADSAQAARQASGALLQAAQWVAALPLRKSDAGAKLIAAAHEIRDDEPLRDQSGRLEHYFDAASLALGGASL